jgi:hexulose-6-phosphate isomerase
MLTKPNVGFIQGRLSPITNKRIQQFPWDTWQNEFTIASKNDIHLIEWTIDTFKFYLNPLINLNQWEEINTIAIKKNILIPSVTCDYFMENPPWKSDQCLIKKGLIAIFQGMKNISAKILVVPLVDNSSLHDSSNTDSVKNFFIDLIPEMIQNNIQIAFECDLNPDALLQFINEFDKNYFGINYDTGNSASLGFDPNKEFAAYGTRIINVHVKDRKLNGPTIPLGEGDADFLRIFGLLQEVDYQGNLILQTARSKEGKHAEVLVKYKSLVEEWWREAKIG